MATTIQDSIQFDLHAEEVVVNTTVKVVANVVTLLRTDTIEEHHKEAIRDVMQQFIRADWQFSNITRSAHASGVEQMTLTATARVAEAENYALDRRREQASRDGLRIASVSTDTSPTQEQMVETQSKLRLRLLQMAQTEQQKINNAMESQYRLGDVIFDPVDESVANVRTARPAQMYGSGFAAAQAINDAGPLGNAVKLTMQARVTLRVKR
jgi:hypothetical protein